MNVDKHLEKFHARRTNSARSAPVAKPIDTNEDSETHTLPISKASSPNIQIDDTPKISRNIDHNDNIPRRNRIQDDARSMAARYLKQVR